MKQERLVPKTVPSFPKTRPSFSENASVRKKTGRVSKKKTLMFIREVSYTNLTSANALVTTREAQNSQEVSKSDPNFPKNPTKIPERIPTTWLAGPILDANTGLVGAVRVRSGNLVGILEN